MSARMLSSLEVITSNVGVKLKDKTQMGSKIDEVAKKKIGRSKIDDVTKKNRTFKNRWLCLLTVNKV